MREIAEKLVLLGADVVGPEFHPTRKAAQIKELESTIKLDVPSDLAHFLTELCGGWKFSWDCLSLLDSNQIEDVFPGSPSGGNKYSQFIGPPNVPLVALYHSQIEQVSEWVEHGTVDEDDFQIVKKCFPLYQCILGSDIIALRLDTSPKQVVYLDHESGFSIGPNHILGRDFTCFLSRYASLGCPDLDYLNTIYNADREIDPGLPDVKRWVEWLAN